MKIIKRYFSYTIIYFSNFLTYIKHIRIKSDRKRKKEVIYIDIKSNIYRRHLANLIFWFTQQGYSVYLKHRFKAIGSMKSFSQKAFCLPDFKITFKKHPDAKLIFTDRTQEKSNTVYFNPDYFSQNGLNHIPLGMQPDMYFKGFYKEWDQIKNNTDRRIGIFFSGNMTEELYSKEIIRTKFNKLSRMEVYKTLVDNFPDTLMIPDTKEDLYKKSLKDKVVFNNRLIVMVPQNEFLSFLSECSFYLFTPGVAHPICHNNFEAMAAGTIPILQYPEYYYPFLEHNKNCIVFKNEKDLINKINAALKMPEETIDKMRQNVNDYYANYLTNQSIVKNIIEANSNGASEFFFGLD